MHLTVKSLTVRYRNKTAVNAVDWDLGPGVHALLGPNGAGKSSLLSTLATLRKPTSGSFSIDGRTGADVRRTLGYLPQDNLGKSRMTVTEHLTYMAWLKEIPEHHTREHIQELLAIAELEDQAHSRISALSGGMRRRVGIASALAGHPQLVILDEPSAGLDVAQRDRLRSIVSRVAQGATVIVSTHIVEDVLSIADTLTVMNKGQFIYVGPWEEFGAGRDLAAVEQRYLQAVAR